MEGIDDGLAQQYLLAKRIDRPLKHQLSVAPFLSHKGVRNNQLL